MGNQHSQNDISASSGNINARIGDDGGLDNNGFNESLNSASGAQFGSSLGLYSGYRTASPVSSTYASNRQQKPGHHPFCLKHNKRRSASPATNSLKGFQATTHPYISSLRSNQSPSISSFNQLDLHQLNPHANNNFLEMERRPNSSVETFLSASNSNFFSNNHQYPNSGTPISREDELIHEKLHLLSCNTASGHPHQSGPMLLDDLSSHHSQDASISAAYGAQLFIALYDFHGVGEDQLSLRRGDQVRVLGYNKSKEWSECQLVAVRQRGSTGGTLNTTSAPLIGWCISFQNPSHEELFSWESLKIF